MRIAKIVIVPLLCLFTLGALCLDESDPYEVWKDNHKRKQELREITTFAAKVEDFASCFKFDRKQGQRIRKGKLERVACSVDAPSYVQTFELLHDNEMLYAYNALREMLHQPLATCVEEVDRSWVKQVAKVAHRCSWLEGGSVFPPPIGVVEIIKESSNYLDMKEEVFPLLDTAPDGGHSYVHSDKSYSVALPALPDRNSRLFTVYHELAHVIHRDVEMGNELSNHNNDVPEPFLNDVEFKKYNETIEEYKKLAGHAIDESTQIGRHMRKIMSQYSVFWQVPVRRKLLRTLTFLRGLEARADLFACQKLYEHNMVQAIVEQIAEWALSKHVTVLDYEEHPSNFERALYMAGFLVSKGVAINELFKKQEANGTCIVDDNIPSMYFSTGLFPQLRDEGSTHFYKAYDQWKRDLQVESYEYWKKEKESSWRVSGTTSVIAQKYDLLFDFLAFIKHLEKIPGFTHYQVEALYNYNMLREFLQLPEASSFEDVDVDWAMQLFPVLWKAQFLAANSLEPLPDKCYSLVWTVRSSLINFAWFPGWYFSNWALYAYNLLRELRGFDQVTTIDAIDGTWLDEQDAWSFRHSVEELWARQGNENSFTQIIFLRDQIKWMIPKLDDMNEAYVAQSKIVHYCQILKERLPSLPDVKHYSDVTDEYVSLVDTFIENFTLLTEDAQLDQIETFAEVLMI